MYKNITVGIGIGWSWSQCHCVIVSSIVFNYCFFFWNYHNVKILFTIQKVYRIEYDEWLPWQRQLATKGIRLTGIQWTVQGIEWNCSNFEFFFWKKNNNIEKPLHYPKCRWQMKVAGGRALNHFVLWRFIWLYFEKNDF